jgi:hypothetical protein
MKRHELAARVLLLLASSLGMACEKKDVPPPATKSAPSAVGRPRPPVAPGELPVDLAKSKVSLKIVKDRDTKSPVGATFGLRDGAIALAAGTARLSIDLDTFESGIPLRNERVRGVFLETSGVGWETAELTIAKIPEEVLAPLRDRKPVNNAKLEADLKLHGASVKLAFVANAGYNAGGALWVKSAEPMEVKISDFALTDNLKKLNTLCQHDSIDDIVRIEASLEFPPR